MKSDINVYEGYSGIVANGYERTSQRARVTETPCRNPV